ncbi:MAG TPA: 2-amino-4-hydroxy-6-hydroxymethyldihydropteridine diphosphokinase [Bacteroidia bacterium]|nr:2-amino-4-hydroxy-6-hydroxymethyldihydropteridine diphosphokinase [Bacteroidia bacterium]
MENFPHFIYLSIGSNMGDRAKNLRDSINFLGGTVGKVLEISPVYKTAAWGNIHQPDFLNIVLKMQSAKKAPELMASFLEIEERMGRKRIEKWEPRLIDIDLLFYGGEVIDLPDLKVPHPGLHLRNFVLVPLNDIAPGFVHPVFQITVKDLLKESSDPSLVIRDSTLYV